MEGPLRQRSFFVYLSGERPEVTTGKADLHVHTSASDGISDVRQVLASAQKAGINVLAITDHNLIHSATRAQALAGQYGLEVVVGEEVSTRDGHLLALFLRDRIPPKLSLSESIAAVHDQGGIAVIAHPYDPVSNGVLNPWRNNITEERLLALGFDAMEAFNACLVGKGPNQRARLLAERAGRAIVSGSDAHSAATVGLACTYFPGRSAADLKQAILTAETVPSGSTWTLRQYADLLRKRELRYAGVAASYAIGLCSGAAFAAALALRSGITRLF